jgi:hypothetical protein
MPSPVRLTDDQLTALMRLAQPLQPQHRDTFLRLIAHELQGRADIGDGELHRVACDVIKSHQLFDPPNLSSGPTSKYR